jgi:hypothetical protein
MEQGMRHEVEGKFDQVKNGYNLFDSTFSVTSHFSSDTIKNY